jgi:hypothetical protein
VAIFKNLEETEKHHNDRIRRNLEKLEGFKALMPEDFELGTLLDQHDLPSLIASIEETIKPNDPDIDLFLETVDRLSNLSLSIESLAKKMGISYYVFNAEEMDKFLKEIVERGKAIDLKERIYNIIGYTILIIHISLLFKAFGIIKEVIDLKKDKGL